MDTYIKPPRTGLEAFELMPEGTLCQLINNFLIMSPAPTPNHQSASGLIYQHLAAFVKTNKAGKVFFSPIDVYLDDKNVYQPDLVFISKERSQIIDWKKGIMGAPDLVIEILSAGNKRYDLRDKKKVYEAAGVKEYWVVDPDTKWCEGFLLTDGTYTSAGEGNGQLTIQMFNLAVSF